MLTIIEIKDREDGGPACRADTGQVLAGGWIAVPPELEQTAWDCAGCDLDIQDGKLVGLTPGQP
ncbi:MAG: hypothetical protein ACLT5P_04900 [Flavonifractor plautii]